MTETPRPGGRIQTVPGPIAPEALGVTLMHEHLLCDITPPALRGAPGLDTPITLHSRYDIDYGRRPHAGKPRMLDRQPAVAEVSRRAGLIGEIGCSETWTAQEQRVMAGAVLAQQETGAALTIHPG
ncbi:phosphotriesterase family protein [Humitalea rosea]|uniref:Phosphotriesterase family protein n=1 Tax=Humitalea rosea TaxID=990373 RepID=A0A2W7IWH6_9PROT|nr:hypothetical protein [Humitalea rosea]PZW43043.1 phosphotriesterase family protein [Humitalea rosea]